METAYFSVRSINNLVAMKKSRGNVKERQVRDYIKHAFLFHSISSDLETCLETKK